MRSIISIVLIACSFNSIAQNLQTLKTYYDPYTKTQIHEVCTVIAGTPTKNGTYKRYDREGKLDAEGSYLNGYEQGVWKWYENGIINKLHTYNKGKLEGLCEVYDEKGNKIKTWYMKDGVTIKEISYFDNNKMNLLYQKNGINGEWYKNGNKKVEANMKDDVGEGSYTSWYETGVMQEKGVYSKGLKTGKWETFYSDASKERISEYSTDNKIIQEIYLYRNGKIKQEKKKINPLQFRVTFFDSISGNKVSVSEITYESSELSATQSDSLVSYYDSNGKDCGVVRVFKNGMRNGTWKKYYDADWTETLDTAKAPYYRIITYSFDKIKGSVKDYSKDGKLGRESELIRDTPEDKPTGEYKTYHSAGTINDSAFYDQAGVLYFAYNFNGKGELEKAIQIENPNSKSYVYGEYDLSKTYRITWFDEKRNVVKSKEVDAEAKQYWTDIKKVYEVFNEK